MTDHLQAEERSYPGGFERRAYDPDHVRPRKTSFSFPLDIPKHYVGNSPFKSALMNGLHLFLPPFERMMVRLFHNEILPKIKDAKLVEQGRGFMHQEGVHSRAHGLYLRNLRAQGYDIDGFCKLLEKILGPDFEGTLTPKLALSFLAAFEHYTDVMVLLFLQSDFLEGCDPRIRDLLRWHAAEEVEHNAVAYEMLRAIDDGYGLRMAGSVLGLTTFLGLVLSGAALLLHQDGELFTRRTGREFMELFVTKHRFAVGLTRLFVHYARPSYHPNDVDYGPLAAEVVAPLPS